MSRHTVCLPSITFNSKTQAVEYFKKMLDRYRDGEELSQDDDVILFELLQRHPEAAEKIGEGVKCFYRSKSLIHPTSCFHIERIDGTATDFSYATCISGNASSLAQQFYEACRFAVSEKLIHEKGRLFKEAGGTMRCAKTGVEITIHEAEYRHTMPKFREIVMNFIKKHKININSELVTRGKDMQYIVKFADNNIENLFKTYHDSESKLAMFKKYVR